MMTWSEYTSELYTLITRITHSSSHYMNEILGTWSYAASQWLCMTTLSMACLFAKPRKVITLSKSMMNYEDMQNNPHCPSLGKSYRP